METTPEDSDTTPAEGSRKTWENSDTVVKTTKREFPFEYANGAKGMLVVVFEAHIKAHMNQEGTASKPPFHPFDTRECHYYVKPYVTRSAYIVEPTGATTPVGELYELEGKYKGVSKPTFLFDHVFGKHEPCSKHRAKFEALKAETTASIIQTFDSFVTTSLVPGAMPGIQNYMKSKSMKAS